MSAFACTAMPSLAYTTGPGLDGSTRVPFLHRPHGDPTTLRAYNPNNNNNITTTTTITTTGDLSRTTTHRNSNNNSPTMSALRRVRSFPSRNLLPRRGSGVSSVDSEASVSSSLSSGASTAISTSTSTSTSSLHLQPRAPAALTSVGEDATDPRSLLCAAEDRGGRRGGGARRRLPCSRADASESTAASRFLRRATRAFKTPPDTQHPSTGAGTHPGTTTRIPQR